MQLQKLSDENLLRETKNLVQQEREILTTLLHHLAEIDRRKLFSDLKYPSLYEYCVHELGYPEDQAYRRISAMRTLRNLPREESHKIEQNLVSGELCLTHLNLAHAFFRQEEKRTHSKLGVEKKMEVFQMLKGTSTRQAEKTMESFLTDAREEVFEFKLSLTKEQMDKVRQYKALVSHKYPHLEMNELFGLLLDQALKKEGDKYLVPDNKHSVLKIDQALENSAEIINDVPAVGISTIDVLPIDILSNGKHQSLSENYDDDQAMISTCKTGLMKLRKNSKSMKTISPLFSAPRISKNSRYISAAVKREVRNRDQNKCTRCHSSYFLEIDHIKPVALGGNGEAQNLRVLCRNCNQRAAWRNNLVL